MEGTTSPDWQFFSVSENYDAAGDWWVYVDTATDNNGSPAGGKRRLIPEGGLTSRVRDHVRPRDPGGGAVSTVSPQRMKIDDVFQTEKEQSGGGPQLHPPPPRSFDGMD